MIFSVLSKIILPLDALPLETYLLIQPDCPMIISNHSQLDPMNPSGSGQADALVHQGCAQPGVLKILMQVDEEITRSAKSRISSERYLKVPNDLLTMKR